MPGRAACQTIKTAVTSRVDDETARDERDEIVTSVTTGDSRDGSGGDGRDEMTHKGTSESALSGSWKKILSDVGRSRLLISQCTGWWVRYCFGTIFLRA